MTPDPAAPVDPTSPTGPTVLPPELRDGAPDPGGSSAAVAALAALASVVPVRTADLVDARAAYDRDGAVVVELGDVSEGAMQQLLRDLFGDRLRNVGAAVEVRAAGGKDRPDLDADGHRIRAPFHTDGFALGDGAPDVLALGCERAAACGGGASFLLDVDRVRRELAAGVDPDLAAFLTAHVVDQTEPGKLPLVGPIGMPLPDGTVAWRCTPHLAPTADDPDPDATRASIARWQALVGALEDEVTRYHLRPGDVLVSDNARTFHGRDPYEDTGRLLWRLWGWTDDAPRPDTAYAGSDTSLVQAPS